MFGRCVRKFGELLQCCGSVINMYEVLKSCGSVIVVCEYNGSEVDVYGGEKRR
jgi:hypothetical protein